MPTSHQEICKQPHRTFWLCHPSIVARKTWYEKYRYDEKIALGQDFNLWLRSYETSRFSNIAEPHYYYRLEGSYRLKKVVFDRMISAKFLFEHYRNNRQLGKALLYSFMQYAKMLAGIGMCTTLLRKKLFARRFIPLSAERLAAYLREIQDIKNTVLPLTSDRSTA